MRVSEMREREPYDAVLRASLEVGLSAYTGQDQRLDAPIGQRWWYQPLFGAYHGDEPSAPVRKWLRDFIRFTPVRWRLPAQFLVGTVGANARVLRLTQQRAFSVSPGLEHPHDSVILPGNQRIRLLCFESNTTRTWSKQGFDVAGLEREVRARSRTPGPFLPVLKHAADFSWLEEELVDGYVLPRVPPWYRVRAGLEDAFGELDAWSNRQAKTVDAEAYVQELRRAAQQLEAQVMQRFGWVGVGNEPLESLCRSASRLGEVRRAPGHGDLQPGNVLVRHSGEVVLIDWEHSGTRSWFYDRMVFGLSSRAPGWHRGWPAFLNGGAAFPFEGFPRARAWRRGALALFRLEELVWYLREALSGPYLHIPRSLLGCTSSLSRGADEYRVTD